MTAIVVNHNGGEDLLACVEHLLAQSVSIEVIVVDNRSTDGSADDLRRSHPEVTVLFPTTNLGYAGGANHGARAATCSRLLFMNPDVYLEPDAVAELIDALDDAAGVAGPVLEVEASGQIEFGAVIDIFCYPKPLTSRGEPLYVPGSALAIRRELFERLGGYDERLFMFVEDVDLCWRALLAGMDVTVAPRARGWHRGAGSTPGGYGKAGRKRPSRFRLVMRERNSFTVLLKCAPAHYLPWVIPAYLVQTLVTAIVSLLLLRPSVTIDMLRGVGWNARNLQETIALRRKVPATGRGRRMASRRIRITSYKLVTVLRHGLPSISR